MSSFDDVRTKRNGRWQGCPRCGAEKNVGAVRVLLLQLGPNGVTVGTVATKSRSLCEPCAVEVYKSFGDVLESSPAREAS